MLQDYIKHFRFYVSLVLLVPGLLLAANKNTFFVEGEDYTKLADSTRQNPSIKQLLNADPHKVQVLFFFSYGCHGCEMMHTPFDAWAKKQNPQKTKIYFYPVSFNAQWGVLARLFYVREALDPHGKLNNAIFNAIHREGLRLWDVDVMRKFFVKHGFSAAQFDSAYNAFIVNMQVQRAQTLSKAYSVTATPDIIVNGPINSYRIEVGRLGKDFERLIDILTYLVAKEAKLL